jgi:hypothetical protein
MYDHFKRALALCDDVRCKPTTTLIHEIGEYRDANSTRSMKGLGRIEVLIPTRRMMKIAL